MDLFGDASPRAKIPDLLPPDGSQEPRNWSNRRSRNYWSHLDPADFGDFPDFTPLPYLVESRLIIAAQQGDTDALKRIWGHHMRLVLKVVNGYGIPSHLMADALQEGLIGIQRAVMKFEVERYVAFVTYAWYWVAQRIHRFLTKHRFGIRVPAHLYGDLCRFRRELHDCGHSREWYDWWDRWHTADPRKAEVLHRIRRLSDTDRMSGASTLEAVRPGPVDTILLAERRCFVLEAVDRLDDRERWIIIRRYGLDGRPENTLEELGLHFRMTRERVRQVQKIAETRLHRLLSEYPEWCGSTEPM